MGIRYKCNYVERRQSNEWWALIQHFWWDDELFDFQFAQNISLTLTIKIKNQSQDKSKSFGKLGHIFLVLFKTFHDL